MGGPPVRGQPELVDGGASEWMAEGQSLGHQEAGVLCLRERISTEAFRLECPPKRIGVVWVAGGDEEECPARPLRERTRTFEKGPFDLFTNRERLREWRTAGPEGLAQHARQFQQGEGVPSCQSDELLRRSFGEIRGALGEQCPGGDRRQTFHAELRYPRGRKHASLRLTNCEEHHDSLRMKSPCGKCERLGRGVV